MALDPKRVAMIWAALEKGGRVGSGYFVNDHLVLTAGFIVRESDGDKIIRETKVRQLGSKEWITARLVWASTDGNMALLEHDALNIESSDAPEFGEITGTNPIRCTAVGFPAFKVSHDNVRDAEQLIGDILPLSHTEGGLFDIALTTSFPTDPASRSGPSPWAGMSGAAVFAGDYLVGLIVRDPAQVERRLIAAAIAPFITDPGFTDLLKLPSSKMPTVSSDERSPTTQSVHLDQSNPDANSAPHLGSPSEDRAPGSAEPDVTYLAGYAADTAIGEDNLDISEDVRSLCSVLMAEQVRPPLSVGLFGDWGTGKSFFMQKMRERIESLAAESTSARNEGRPSPYCENVRQITFNAWHYIDANLWASIVTQIFDGLALDDLDETMAPTVESRRRAESRRRQLLAKLETAELLSAEARQRRDAARAWLDTKRAEREQKHEAISSLTALRFADIQTALREHPEVATMAAKAVEARTGKRVDSADALALSREVHGTWSAIRRIWRGMELRARLQLVALAIFAAFVAAVLAAVGQTLVTRVFASLAIALPALVLAIRWLPTIRQVRVAADVAAKTVANAVQREQNRLDSELAAVGEQIDVAQRQIEEAEREIAEVREGRRLRDFIESRASSQDYRSGLGIIALVRRDLARLSALMADRDPIADDEPGRIDRIILYIDDLDRCPARRVVEVLEAVHLLLAFPLFVVVVGVDARWLLRSLELHYTEVITSDSHENDVDDALHWAATPQNYLEKIFQIPFSLRHMEKQGFARLIQSAVSVRPPSQAEAVTAIGENELLIAEGGVQSGELTPPMESQDESRTSSPRVVDPEPAPSAKEVSRSALPRVPQSLAFAVEGRRLATIYGGLLALLDPRTGLVTRSRPLGGDATTAILAVDGSLIAISSPEGLQVQDLISGVVEDVWTAPIALPAFSIDSRWICGLEGGQLVARELQTKRELRSGDVVPTGTKSCHILSNARAAVVAGSYGVRIIPFNGTQAVPLTDRKADALGVSGGGQFVTAADGDSIRIWDVRNGRLLDWLSIGRPITALALAPDASLLAIASGTSLTIIDRLNSMQLAQASHDSPIEHIVFSPNGRTLSSAGSDGVRTWTPIPDSSKLASENLQLNDSEVEFLQRLLPLVSTPRAAKRLVNVYQILRVSLHDEDLDRLIGTNGHRPEHPAVLLLLAVVSGFPEQANEIIEGLLSQPTATTWDQFLATFRQKTTDEPRTSTQAIWSRFFERLDSVETHGILPKEIAPYAWWAPRVARYSFRTGRLADSWTSRE
jgi:hypothetical protein